MTKDSLDEFIGVVLGIVGGIALVEFVKKYFQKRCPNCGNLNESNLTSCKFCGANLKW